MSMIKTVVNTVAGGNGGTYLIDNRVIGFDPSSQPYNAQITVTDENGGGLGAGKYQVLLRSPGGAESYQEHVVGRTAVDTVMVAGKDAPIFTAIKLIFADCPANVQVKLSIWPRGI